MEAQASLRDIEHNCAVAGAESHVSNVMELRPRIVATFFQSHR
jgi:hypothetical protein